VIDVTGFDGTSPYDLQMAHSYVSSMFHVVFSTKERMQLIRADLQPRLRDYLAAVARNHGVRVLAVGGTENHIHILIALSADAKLSDIVRTLKCNSSRWLRETKPLFSWQEGYGAFSVSPSQLERVKKYIANQDGHHHSRTFEDEFLAMLKAAKIEFQDDQVFG
jgi:REP element-mobilizing transposase RayT